MPEIAAIILNWNQYSLTIACIQSLIALDIEPGIVEIVIVDNGSTDESVVKIQAAFPGVTLIQNKANLGYAGGNNVGIQHALESNAKYIYVINNDVIVSASFLNPLLQVLATNPTAGIATPLIFETNQTDRVWAVGTELNWKTGRVEQIGKGEPAIEWQNRLPFAIDIAPGAAMLIKREVFETVGLLDEAFYLYYEEADWCLRAQKAGYGIIAVPQALVWHHVSASMGETSPFVDYYMLRNQLRFLYKHWSGYMRPYLLCRTILRNLLTIAAYTIKSHAGQRLPHRNARVFALRDAIYGRWGKMSKEAVRACSPPKQ